MMAESECLDCIVLDDCVILCALCQAEQNAEVAPLEDREDRHYDDYEPPYSPRYRYDEETDWMHE